ncbi:DNA-binding transcriptional regulator, MerR family [Salibacterium halotolerans]|uniref:DNA-binding transcriptional regulator, MerR family n=1 Tax=Salibacterium halotolerans TaxID=1884432 RepID=A0A1I5Y130_9BACI|nr:DNA-binding transcriptional regulator, MerR family [Salibacterium halotolerans]
MHYYDQINLLKPSTVKENGYRYYDKDGLIKLQTILALKSMDYSLDEIKVLLNRSESPHISQEDAWLRSLNEQLNYASKKIDKLKRKQFILRSMSQTIEMSGQYNEEHIFQLIKRIDSPDFIDGEIPATFSSDIFTEDEVKTLEQLPLVGSDDPRIYSTLELVKETRKKMHVPPNSPATLELAKKWRHCISSWFKGDVKLQEKYFNFIDSVNKNNQVIFGLDKKLINYVDKILGYLNKEEIDKS